MPTNTETAESDTPPLLIVSEPARTAAVTLTGTVYQVVSYHEVTEDLLAGRNVLYWPDAGETGLKKRSLKYAKHCHQLKRLSMVGQPKGWNAAAALRDGWTFKRLSEWARPRVDVIEHIPELAEESPPTDSQYVRLERLGLALSKDGRPICNAANVVRLLKNDPTYQGHIWFDEFSRGTYTDLDGLTREWTDANTISLMIALQDELGMHRVTSSMVSDAVHFYAQRDTRHQVRDWLSKLEWDQKPRIGGFFPDYLGADSSASMSAFGNNFWVLMVKRIMHPGCQADYMVVLEGGQGIGKTRALQIIGGRWYAEVGIAADSEDFERQLQGKILIEIAELHSFTKADQSRIKQIITKRVDRYREKYGKIAVDHPRQGLLAGTTNESEWIKDQTGGRRFWPVRCGVIDLDGLKRDRDQLFAEAFQRFKSGDEGYLVPIQETSELQDDRREHDVWEDALKDNLSLMGRVTLLDAMGLLGIPKERMDRRAQLRVANVLRALGFFKTVLRNRGILQKTWVKHESNGVTSE